MQVPAAAYVCGHCRKRLRMSGGTRGCLVLVAIFVGGPLLMMVYSISNPPPRPSAPARATSPLTAEAAARAAAQAKADHEEMVKAEAKWKASPAGKLQAKHPDWSRDDCKMIVTRNVHMGMTAEQVRLAWGKPDHINATTTANRTNEQWVWGSGQYAYFDDGIRLMEAI
jgi:hypothetical protein